MYGGGRERARAHGVRRVVVIIKAARRAPCQEIVILSTACKASWRPGTTGHLPVRGPGGRPDAAAIRGGAGIVNALEAATFRQ